MGSGICELKHSWNITLFLVFGGNGKGHASPLGLGEEFSDLSWILIFNNEPIVVTWYYSIFSLIHPVSVGDWFTIINIFFFQMEQSSLCKLGAYHLIN